MLLWETCNFYDFSTYHTEHNQKLIHKREKLKYYLKKTISIACVLYLNVILYVYFINI